MESPLQQKSFAFAVRIVNVAKVLSKDRSEHILSKQLLRSGTSIGANIEEAQGGYSKKEFINKLQIAYKEARETNYWIRLLEAGLYISEAESTSLRKELGEILAMLTASLKTAKDA